MRLGRGEHEEDRGQTPISAFVFVEKLENGRVSLAFRPFARSGPGFGVRLDRIGAVFQKESRHFDAAEATGPTERCALFPFVADVETGTRVEKNPCSCQPFFFVAEALRNGPWAARHLVHDGGSAPREV